MKLFKYMLRDYFKSAVTTLSLCLFLFVLFDFIHKTTTYFEKYNPAPLLVAKYYFYQIPFQVLQILPVASLIASVLVMVILGRSNEITAMRAIGLSPMKIALPLIFGGGVLSFCSFVLSENVIPWSSQKMHYISDVLIEGEKIDVLSDDESQWMKNKKILINFDHYDFSNQELSGLKVIKVREKEFKIEEIFLADIATYKPETKEWRLHIGKTIRFNEMDVISKVTPWSDLVMKLPIDPKKLRVDRRKPDELSLWELSELISKKSNLGGDVLGLKVAWHIKLAYPFACIIISLIGLQFGYKSERTVETVKSVLFALALGMSYWFILSACRALGVSGSLPPHLCGWTANVILLSLVSIQIWRLARQ